MARALDTSKASAVLALKPGDKIELTDGQIATFVRANRTKFIGEMEGRAGIFTIPMNMFVRIVGSNDKPLEEHMCMTANEYFYANEEGKAVLYIYESNLGHNIVAHNPITDKVVYVSVDTFAKRLKFGKK